MWLINVGTHRLEYFATPDPGSYDILSHTWEEEEVSFQDFANLERAEKMAGFAKIAKTCKLAEARGRKYAWVDTCCIDKSSSAELSEAINSMFKWYRTADVCHVYLSDLDANSRGTLPRKPPCRWFTRGWTLQELIAPQNVFFYDKTWSQVGTKVFLGNEIAKITGIDLSILFDSSLLGSVPVGRRMSWAAGRETTRAEDVAYSLLGIFDVNMPMLYGEGDKAFIRLQDEIIKETNDLSLFAWVDTDDSFNNVYRRGLFAQSPSNFANCRRLENETDLKVPPGEFTITNRGVRFNTCLAIATDPTTHVLKLNCKCPKQDIRNLREPHPYPDRAMIKLGIYLDKTPQGYVRIKSGTLHPAKSGEPVTKSTTVYVRKKLSDGESKEKVLAGTESGIGIRFTAPGAVRLRLVSACPSALWDESENMFLCGKSGGFVGMVELSASERQESFSSAEELRSGGSACRILVVCGTGQIGSEKARSQLDDRPKMSSTTVSAIPKRWGTIFVEGEEGGDHVFTQLADLEGFTEETTLNHMRYNVGSLVGHEFESSSTALVFRPRVEAHPPTRGGKQTTITAICQASEMKPIMRDPARNKLVFSVDINIKVS